MDIKNVVFIYNPVSGKGKIDKHIEYIKNEIIKKYGSCDIIKTTSLSHLKESINKSSLNYDLVIFSGGDGTFSAAVDSIPYENDNLPLYAYLPSGSICDMGYNLGISKNYKKALKQILNESEIKDLDIGYIGDKKFSYVFCHGAMTDVPYITPQKTKNRLGNLAYLLYGIKEAFHLKTFDVTINNNTYNTPLCLISNSRMVGFFKIDKKGLYTDGGYWCMIVKKGKGKKSKGLSNLIYTFLFGVDKALKKKKIILLREESYTISCEENIWDTDGEFIEESFPIEVGLYNKKIKIFTRKK